MYIFILFYFTFTVFFFVRRKNVSGYTLRDTERERLFLEYFTFLKPKETEHDLRKKKSWHENDYDHQTHRFFFKKKKRK